MGSRSVGTFELDDDDTTPLLRPVSHLVDRPTCPLSIKCRVASSGGRGLAKHVQVLAFQTWLWNPRTCFVLCFLAAQINFNLMQKLSGLQVANNNKLNQRAGPLTDMAALGHKETKKKRKRMLKHLKCFTLTQTKSCMYLAQRNKEKSNILIS